MVFLILGVCFGLASICPVDTGEFQSQKLISNDFRMGGNEVRRQGIGAFQGGENLTILVLNPDHFLLNFSIVTYTGSLFENYTDRDISCPSFTVGADYYEAVFVTNGGGGELEFEVTSTEPQVVYPMGWLGPLAKALFIASLAALFVVLLNTGLVSLAAANLEVKQSLPRISRVKRRRLLILVAVSMAAWFVLLAINPNPLGTFENWYTDHARHPYTASLFLKDGFEVFSQPLDTLASRDSSPYMFVTWPEMPHLYPVGSIAVFLPFGALLEAGVDGVLVYKLEIAVFLVFAHLCLFLFLEVFLKKDLHLFWKLVVFYIMYVTLVIYAADGMFDSIAFLFGFLSVTMFFREKYDGFVLLVLAASVFKYQAAIFLFPFIAVGVVRLFERHRVLELLRNKLIWVSAAMLVVTGLTAYLSLPFLIQTRPELVMNGVNAFISHSQIPWTLQSLAVLVTLAGTLAYAVYMLKRNTLLSLSSLFLLLPSFTLPYFQNWYLPFYFIYILIPQKRRDLEVTMAWLIFIIFILSFGGVAFSPVQIFGHLQSMFGS